MHHSQNPEVITTRVSSQRPVSVKRVVKKVGSHKFGSRRSFPSGNEITRGLGWTGEMLSRLTPGLGTSPQRTGIPGALRAGWHHFVAGAGETDIQSDIRDLQNEPSQVCLCAPCDLWDLRVKIPVFIGVQR